MGVVRVGATPTDYTIDIVSTVGTGFVHKQIERRGGLCFVRCKKTRHIGYAFEKNE